MEKKMIGGRTPVVRPIPDLKQVYGCQILFVSSGQSKHPRALLDDLRVSGLLIVGEVAGFAKDGGVVNFKLKGGSIHLEINVSAAERERLHISSKLLSLAEIVK
jgi:YfiR/HmsC-like